MITAFETDYNNANFLTAAFAIKLPARISAAKAFD